MELLVEVSYLSSLQGMAPRPELADEVYALLRAHILRGTIPPGVRINIYDVARQLNVSPTPVRETLARLESEGLVDRQPRRGYRATELLGREDVRDLYELRLLLEPNAVKKATERKDAGALRLLSEELAQGQQLSKHAAAISSADLSAHDERFHDLIFQAAGNDLIRQSYMRTHCHLHIFRLDYSHSYDDHTILEHEQILTAVLAGDAGAAADAMRRHITASEERVLRYFERQEPTAANVRQ